MTGPVACLPRSLGRAALSEGAPKPQDKNLLQKEAGHFLKKVPAEIKSIF